MRGIPNPKIVLQVFKKLEKSDEIPFYNNKLKKEYDKLTSGNLEFAECKIWQSKIIWQNFHLQIK
jgi:hypothetical protein